jgi:hypothetical protein
MKTEIANLKKDDVVLIPIFGSRIVDVPFDDRSVRDKMSGSEVLVDVYRRFNQLKDIGITKVKLRASGPGNIAAMIGLVMDWINEGSDIGVYFSHSIPEVEERNIKERDFTMLDCVCAVTLTPEIIPMIGTANVRAYDIEVDN